MKSKLVCVSVVLCTLVVVVRCSMAQPPEAPPAEPTQPTPEEQAARQQDTQEKSRFLNNANRSGQWATPAEPAHVVGPIYFVGTRGLGSFLITGSEGHILVYTGMPGSGELIEKSITQLGFQLSDIKIILTGHAHVDHVGGHAYLQKASGAKIAMMREDVPTFETGGAMDFYYAGVPVFEFEGAKVDTLLHDEEEITLGDIKLTAYLTPGHTRGSTTYVTTIHDGEQSYTVVFPDGTSVNPGYRLTENPSYPGIADDFRRTFARLESLKPDIWLTPHNPDDDFDAKLARAKDEGVSAWVDPDGYQRFVAMKKARFESALASER